ncbi:ras guanine nucleotide exchange factor domain-containing protein [Cytidiella melzeri]|nr:ras guanine nucleotide exchange factor domain-containing protein [Cytidiella melzeri]
MADSVGGVSRVRHLPKLSIDPATSYQRASLASYSSLSTSTRASIASSFESTPNESDPNFPVLCLYDYSTEDPDQMAFRAEEILRVIKTEDSGWWAAVRPGDNKVGWIPNSYVEPLPEHPCLATAEEQSSKPSQSNSLAHVSAPPLRYDRPFDTTRDPIPWDFGRHWRRTLDDKPLPHRPIEISGSETRVGQQSAGQEIVFYPSKLAKAYPPLPSMPLPATPKSAPIHANNADIDDMDRKRGSRPPMPGLNRAVTCPAPTANSPISQTRYTRPRPVLIKENVSPTRLSVLTEMPQRSVQSLEDLVRSTSTLELVDPTMSETMSDIGPPAMPRPGKVKQITGDDEAEAIHFNRTSQASCPWFMKPIHGDDQITVEYNGSVTAGTLPALVEKLTLEPLSLNVDKEFRHVFLTTFRTMGTADEVFDLLLRRYYLESPAAIAPSELDEWKARCLLPSQRRVLSIFTTWLEEHSMVEDDPPIARRLQNFLAEITAPAENVVHAQKVMMTLERLTFAVPIAPQTTIKPPKRRRTRDSRHELLRLDPATIATNLCLYEHALYAKVRPQECLNWVKTRTGDPVANLSAFCALHDKVAAWVKQTVLWSENVGSRADLLDFWIKVAEKSRTMRNFNSMSAIVTALSSTVIQRLHLTWAYVGKASHLAPLNQLNDPAGSFSAYRQAQHATDTPCVPFIGMYLTDILHINDQYHDSSVSTGSSTKRMFHFVKRRKWSDTLDTILAHQKRPYPWSQDLMTVQFIEASLARASEVVQAAFWAQSHDIQAAERQRSDIRKGLEAAGF